MIRSFGNKQTEALFRNVRIAKEFRPIADRAKNKLALVDAAVSLSDLRSPPGNRLEALSGDREGTWSIRINDRWRVCFRWSEGDAYDVEIVDYH